MTEGLGIHKAICALKLAIAQGGGVQKERKAPMGYSFRGIEDFDNILCGLSAEHGVAMYPRVTDREVIHGTTAKGGYQSHVFLTIDWTFVCASDGSREVVTTCGEAMDTQDKAINKAMQASRKYAILMVLMIPTAGDDTEIYVPEPAPVPAAPISSPAQVPVPELPRGDLLPAKPRPAPPRVGAPGKRGPNKPKPDGLTLETNGPDAAGDIANGTVAPTEAASESLLGRIGEVQTFPLLFAIAGDADKTTDQVARDELMLAVKHRAVLLFADAKNMDGVKEGFDLVRALGSPDDLKRAANEAFVRFRR